MQASTGPLVIPGVYIEEVGGFHAGKMVTAAVLTLFHYAPRKHVVMLIVPWQSQISVQRDVPFFISAKSRISPPQPFTTCLKMSLIHGTAHLR